jgi:hypothetical protein
MQMHRTFWPALVLAPAFVFWPAGARAQAPPKLLFVPIPPCRIAQTINIGGPIAANSVQAFQVLGPSTNYSAQGGNAAGCGIPDLGAVQAVFFNFVAQNPSGPGNLRAYAGDGILPSASTLNFQLLNPNLNIANGVAIPVRTTGAPGPGTDLNVYAGGSSTHVVIDAVGYFTRAEPRKYYITTSFQNGSAAATACAAGYHFASLPEIFDTSGLQYNTSLGPVLADSGQGPPVRQAWVRTGYTSSANNVAGQGNCLTWTSSSGADFGTIATLGLGWLAPPVNVSPWAAAAVACSSTNPSWCVED